ncbi:NAD(P)H-binding protein [Lactococcus garvieae]|uniref:NAD(P)H-binding protein n=1 Tax=Lactococcus garvieae TaxID=1363 RepID=UPI003855172A
MVNVLIIGATGSLGRSLRRELSNTNHKVTLFSRSVTQLSDLGVNETAIAGSVTNPIDLSSILTGQDIIFAALSGNLTKMAKDLTAAMEETKVKRLIFISSMGIYNEIPSSVDSSGNLKNNPMLKDYRNAADIVEQSSLDYTIIRPGWFDNGTDDYKITHKGEPFRGYAVSRGAISKLVHQIIEKPQLYSNESIGISRP